MLKRIISFLLVSVLLLASVSALAAKTYALGDRVLKSGMKGDDVKEAQLLLKELKYYSAKIDGIYGTATQKAVKDFQKKNSLTVDGVLGSKTVKKLTSGSALAADAKVVKEVILSVGSSGEKVKELQRQLRQTYYYGGKIDGKFGAEVLKAVKAFQTSAGITVDGKVGDKTRNYLYNRKAVIFNGGIPKRTLQRGDRGYDVYVVQEKLKSLNYSPSLNGIFDAQTVAAVKAFQKMNGISESGVVNATLRRHLWPVLVNKAEETANAKKGTADDPYEEPVLKKGSSGTVVARAQMFLKAGRYLLGAADGYFGITTENAVKTFQKANGLKVDGIIGKATWAVLKTLNLQNAESVVLDSKKNAASSPLAWIKPGDKNIQVKRLQQNLIQLGYLAAGEDDGIFGIKTYRAVRLFQKANKIKVDGIVGEMTMIKINEKLGIQYII